MSLNRQIPGKPVVPSNRRLPNHVPIGRKAGRMPAPQGNRSVPCRVLIGLTAVNLMVGSPVLAQQRTPDFVNIRKTNLAGIDRNNVEAWVAEQMQQLFAAKDDKAVQTQGLAFLNTVTTHVKDTSATEGFRTGMAGIVADGFIKSYKAAPVDRRPLAAVYLLLTLQQIVEAAQPAQAPQNLIDAFTLALADPTAGARTMGATGLSTLREKFTQPQWTALLPVIQRAAPDEPNEVALDRMYRLLMVGPNVPVDTVPVILAILEARLTRFEQNNGFPRMPDAEVAKWLGEKVLGMNNPETQNQATLDLARLLANAVYAYVNKPGEKFLEGLERSILASEAQLKTIVTRRAPGTQLPNVAAAFEKAPVQTDAMLLALNKWIGTVQDEGVLNRQPFVFQRGLKIAPPGATRPATRAAAPGGR